MIVADSAAIAFAARFMEGTDGGALAHARPACDGSGFKTAELIDNMTAVRQKACVISRLAVLRPSRGRG